ncbi:HAD-IA family hydrolase [Vibrio alfacsensis]|uniref:HAD-IA family hydrolase n=1 Tax=Vibrio alfacsensis TaxID=1074311 RepID=UPI001BF03610|nr:HAD-IA family hydrolase [Vibrio alfacsensis]BBM66668.1 haloacid dehalogenase [Vibrio alfacsensis]BCN26062.1 haloacid dehalogenase [Vibrio alfacsensis]
MDNIKCVIFDCDGTLVDSERLCCQALVDVFSQYGADIPLDECVAHFKGGKLADILSDAKELMNIDVSIDVLEPQYRDVLQALFVRHLMPMDGAHELIKFLDFHQIEYCVASNGPKDKIEYSLELTGLLRFFKGKIFSAFDTNSWKPEPDLIMYSAMSMGFLPSDCLYVDDTPKGVEAGLNAGVRTVQLYNGMPITLVQDSRVSQIGHLSELKEQLVGCSV